MSRRIMLICLLVFILINFSVRAELFENFDGLYTGYIGYAPDLSIAKGPQYIVEVFNATMGIYNEEGSLINTIDLSEFFSSVYNGTPKHVKIFYHPELNKYFLVAVGDKYYLTAFTETSNPNYNWIKFKSDASFNNQNSTNLHPSKPDVSYNQDWLVITSNQYDNSNQWMYAKVRVFKFSDILQGIYDNYTDFWNKENSNGTLVHSFSAAHHLSQSEAFYLLNNGSIYNGDFLTVWKIYEDIDGNIQMVREASFTIGAYEQPPDAQQKNNSNLINTGDCRLQNVVYQNGYLHTVFTLKSGKDRL